jgi:acyl carrier protein
MLFEIKLLVYLQKKYGKKISLNSYVFLDLNVDSFEFIKLVLEIEKKFNKKYKPGNFVDFSNLNIKQLSKLFK